ncbi:MAG TPA: hypothetical protein VGQ83_28725 [Polyangia bacterium]|jgi:hypothetical protein
MAEVGAALGAAPARIAVMGPPALGQMLARAGHLVLALGHKVGRLASMRQRLLKGQAPSFTVVRALPAALPVPAGSLDAIVYAGALPAGPTDALLEWERGLKAGGRVVIVGSVHAGLATRLRARLGGARLTPLRAEDYARLLLCSGFTDVTQVWPRGVVVISAARARKVPA